MSTNYTQNQVSKLFITVQLLFTGVQLRLKKRKPPITLKLIGGQVAFSSVIFYRKVTSNAPSVTSHLSFTSSELTATNLKVPFTVFAVFSVIVTSPEPSPQ